MTDDTIYRQAAVDLVTDMEFMNNTAKGILRDRLRKLPSAQPEIIRCKDCKYGGMKENEEGYCAAGAIEQEITGTDYCSWAERRET